MTNVGAAAAYRHWAGRGDRSGRPLLAELTARRAPTEVGRMVAVVMVVAAGALTLLPRGLWGFFTRRPNSFRSTSGVDRLTADRGEPAGIRSLPEEMRRPNARSRASVGSPNYAVRAPTVILWLITARTRRTEAVSGGNG